MYRKKWLQKISGNNIVTFRKEKNLTQSELAELIGVSTQAVSKWETGSGMPDISQIVPLARVLAISTDKLLGHTDLAFEKEVTESPLWVVLSSGSAVKRPVKTTKLNIFVPPYFLITIARRTPSVIFAIRSSSAGKDGSLSKLKKT